jgi:hypothetical protein
MKKGDKVKIYHDPITKNQLEWEAKLIKKLDYTESEEYEWWRVKFDDFDESTYERKIYFKK